MFFCLFVFNLDLRLRRTETQRGGVTCHLSLGQVYPSRKGKSCSIFFVLQAGAPRAPGSSLSPWRWQLESIAGATGWDTADVRSEFAGRVTTGNLSARALSALAWTPGSRLPGAGSAAAHPRRSLTWSLPQRGQPPKPPLSIQKPPALMTPESLMWLVAQLAWAQCSCLLGSSQ